MTEGSRRQMPQFLQSGTASFINQGRLVMTGMGFLLQTGQSFFVEGMNRHAHGLITAMQGLSNYLRFLPLMAFKKDLTAAYREG
jgi:hypothetical protein